MSSTPETQPHYLVEYLLTIDVNNPYCSNKATFDNLLKTNADISIKGTSITYKTLNINYNLKVGEISNKKKRYFHLIFGCLETEDIILYSEFLRSVRVIISKFSAKTIVTLWDDISFYYAQKSYPLIHEIENLMRKLFTKFMIINLDNGWVDQGLPQEIREANNYKKGSDDDAFLYNTDFKHLRDFLTSKVKPKKDLNDLYKIIESSRVNTDINLEDLKCYIPSSNWDKYFSKVLGSDLNTITTKWDRLYTLRCKVAHNNSLTKEEYDEIFAHVSILKPIVKQAIDNIDSLEVEEVDKQSVSESLIPKQDKNDYASFIQDNILKPLLNGDSLSFSRFAMIDLMNNMEVISKLDSFHLRALKKALIEQGINLSERKLQTYKYILDQTEMNKNEESHTFKTYNEILSFNKNFYMYAIELDITSIEIIVIQLNALMNY